MRRILFIVFPMLILQQAAYTQEADGNVVFWSAQDWACDFLKIDLYSQDSILVYSGKLDKTYKKFQIPLCGDENTLSVEKLSVGSYFFVADCSVEQCELCGGEGSYWQPIMHSKTPKQNGATNKGNMDGTWRTCYLCGGNGKASTIMWVDTLNVYEDKCRSVLLK